MIIANRRALFALMKKHAQNRGPLSAWNEIVEKSDWKTPADIKKDFVSASFIGANKVIFNIGGNKFRLVVCVIYIGGIVNIEWVGTHSEYNDKIF